MVNKLFLINNSADLDFINIEELKSSESKVFSFDISSHEVLEKNNVTHELADNYLSYEQRVELFEKITKLHEWYNDELIVKNFEFKGVNLLGLLDLTEFYYFIMPELVNFLIIKKIIEELKPKKIISAKNFSTILNILTKGKNIQVRVYGIEILKKLHWDKITIKYNIGSFPISFNISRNRYLTIKNVLEKIINSIFSLWFNFKNSKKKTILLLEFNPAAYPDLLSQLNKYNNNIILINRRRPATWNLESIKILRNNKCKLINFNKLLESKEKNQIQSLVKYYSNKLEKFLSKEHILTQIFVLEKYSFWPIIKDVLINTYRHRFQEYIYLILVAKKIFEKINISCILNLYDAGETEKIFLNVNKKRIPSILLEHGFGRSVNETSWLDVLGSYTNFRDKYAVWSNHKKKYLIDKYGIDSKRILVTGSPRHDLFFNYQSKKETKSQKTILIAPNPITEIAGLDHTELHKKFKKTVEEICTILKKIPSVRIIVKLHPGQLEHNNEIKLLFRKICPSIPIFLWTSVIKIIDLCDTVLVISPQGYSTSTMILESLILNKPVINIVLDGHLYEFEYVKENAIITLTENSDLEKSFSDILFDEKFRNKLIENGKKFVTNFLANPGTASKYFAKIANSY